MNDSLQVLLADGVIDRVLGQLKTGKEAEVWLVEHAGRVIAAKLYKERTQRSFRNNAGYREGREVRNSRTRRAMERGSRFGKAASEEAWKSAEADSLFTLHAQGVRVPPPVTFYEGVLLMELVLDASGQPAPRLVEAPPRTPEEAHALYLELRAQAIRMLCADLIHGDLSAYNVLMGEAGPTLIDFPQTVAAARNNSAEHYFRRDLENIRLFLAGVDPRLHGKGADAREIWAAYVRRDLSADFVPSERREGARRPSGSQRPGEDPKQDAPHQVPRFDGGRQGPGQPPFARPSPIPRPPQRPPQAKSPEAELRELEERFLRQGGGARTRPGPPPPAPGALGDRRERFGRPRKGAPPGGARSNGPKAQAGRTRGPPPVQSSGGGRGQGAPPQKGQVQGQRQGQVQGQRQGQVQGQRQGQVQGQRKGQVQEGQRPGGPPTRAGQPGPRPPGQAVQAPGGSPRRGTPRPSRGGPQISYVTRVPASGAPARADGTDGPDDVDPR
jgi:RIO kinase 1